jgi:hypothetical protein
MRCSQAHFLLQLYIDNRLDNRLDNQLDRQLTLQQIRALEIHLSTCSACREEFRYLKMVSEVLDTTEPVVEPADLAMRVMQRVAQSTQREQMTPALEQPPTLIPLRFSWGEMISAIVLATLTMTAIIFTQPTMRAMLPIANGHDHVSLFIVSTWHMLLTIDSHTLLTAIWIVGTFLGIWITLLVAGSDMRNQWFKAVMDRLPVW